MPVFQFEVIERGHAKASVVELTLPSEREIWPNVEALALQMGEAKGCFIRVKNSYGEAIIRAGVLTALISIKCCRCADCPLKHELARASIPGIKFGNSTNLTVYCPTGRSIGVH